MVVLIKKIHPHLSENLYNQNLKKESQDHKRSADHKITKPLNLTTTPPYLGSRSKTRPLAHFIKNQTPT